jgi:hypothetical protein
MTYLESFMFSIQSNDTLIGVSLIIVVFILLFITDINKKKQPKKKILCLLNGDCIFMEISDGKVYCSENIEFDCFSQEEVNE